MKLKKRTIRMSHLLHCSGSNHDGHGNLETQNSCGDINLAHINQNPLSKSIPKFDDDLIIKQTACAKSIQNKISKILDHRISIQTETRCAFKNRKKKIYRSQSFHFPRKNRKETRTGMKRLEQVQRFYSILEKAFRFSWRVH